MDKIEILMKDGCTRSEAEKHLKRGTIIYDESDRDYYIEETISQGFTKEEAMDSWNEMPKVETYRIMYVL